jgi:hypothetical protein
VLMSPNAIASFSLWWHKCNTFSSSSSSTSCRTNLVSGPGNLYSSAQISIIWGWSSLSTTNISTPHKDIRLTTTLNDLLMNFPTLFKEQPHWHMHSAPPQK